jgi:hypothetical protein
MRNFYLIASGVSVTPLMMDLCRNPQLWNQNTLRTTHPMTPHKEVDDIWLRFNEMPPPGEEHRVIDEHESIDYPAFKVLSAARPLVMSVFNAVAGIRLGRVLITRLHPGGKIEPHIDGGSHAEYYSRHHVVLQSAPGSIFRCGDESVQMETGQVWWFDNSKEHEVVNNSATDRLHLIIDARCK